MKNSQEGRKMGKTRMIQFYNDKWDRLQIQLKKKKKPLLQKKMGGNVSLILLKDKRT